MFIQPIADDLVLTVNCSVWYDADSIADHADPDTVFDLTQMSIFVFPISKKLLCEPNRARDVDLSIALEHHVPILPIMMETGLDDEFADVFGDMQYLDRVSQDETAIAYAERLRQSLSDILVGNDLAERVQEAFVARAFLSYRKKDRVYAQRLMRLLHDYPRGRDIAIWYDEFLVPGEDFNDAISEALKEADLFLLTVTPSLLEDPNYVMSTEYPMALECKKHIIAASMVDTDEDALRSRYRSLPDVAMANNKGDEPFLHEPTLGELVAVALDAVGVSSRKATPEQEYLIGVAYVGGIDVEVDRTRGIELIMNAAQQGYAEAMSYLGIVFWTGNGVERNWMTSIEWGKKAVDAYEAACRAVEDCSKKEQAANLYRLELTALTARLRVVGRLTDAEQTCLRLKELGDEWCAWSDSQESFLALYDALAELTVISVARLQLAQAQEFCDQAYRLLIRQKEKRASEAIDEMLLGNLMQSASIAMMQMNHDLAYEAFQKALKLAEAFADASYTAPRIENTMRICMSLGYIDMVRCHNEDAKAQFRRALAIAEELTAMDPLNEEHKLAPQGYLATVFRSSGELEKSLDIAEEGIRTAVQVRSYTDAGSAWTISMVLYMAKGSCLFELHRWNECRELGHEMLDLGKMLESGESAIVEQIIFLGHFFCCYAALNQGKVSEAVFFWEHMRTCLPADWEHAEDIDTLHFGARLIECRGLLERAQGRSDLARQHFEEMRKSFKKQVNENGLFAQTGLDYGYACLQSCEVALDLDDVTTATRLASEACEIFGTLVFMGTVAANSRCYCHALSLVGRAALMEGRVVEALEAIAKAVELGDDLLAWDQSEDSNTVVSDCHYQLAECYRNNGDIEQAEEQYLIAADISARSADNAETLRSLYGQILPLRSLAVYMLDVEARDQYLKEAVEPLESKLRQEGSQIVNFRALF